jgi:glucose-6-phosphate 1-dehydrogenase
MQPSRNMGHPSSLGSSENVSERSGKLNVATACFDGAYDQRHQTRPCVFVMVGATGDLARRKLIPAIYNLALDNLLPLHFALVGFGRSQMDDTAYRKFIAEAIQQYSRRPIDNEHWSIFQRSTFLQPGSLEEQADCQRLKARLEQIELLTGTGGNRIVYFSIPPGLFEIGARQLKAAGLLYAHSDREPFLRLVIEKPFGIDLETAIKLNRTLLEILDESQIYRTDHYLGKETVQNILVTRFADSIFEPIWNRHHVDHIQMMVAEVEGVGTRAGYYDNAGALRDMVQNHMLQLLCMTAMEAPWSTDADAIRDQKMTLLRCLRPIPESDARQHVVYAQYREGCIMGQPVPGYRSEAGIRSDSTTETFVAVRAFIDNFRWAGVPFYLRTGKRLPKRTTEITVHFKEIPRVLFNANLNQRVEPNTLVFGIQPNEGISLTFSAKAPGPRVRIVPVKMDFRYGAAFGEHSAPEAYERLLLDVMAGDQTLFMRRDEIEAAWAWIDTIQRAWRKRKASSLPEYPAGSWGPREADELIASDGRKWRTP